MKTASHFFKLTFAERIPMVFIVGSIFLLGCSSKLVVQSDPAQADIFVAIEGQSQKIKIGQTPLELTEEQIAEKLKLTAESSQWVEFTFEKKDFESKTIYLPSNRFGELTRIFKIKLKPSEDSSTTVVKMMRYFFNAKKFAETRQFERAHAEIDKVLALDSQIPQAYAMKAGIFFLQQNMQDAANLYTKALEIDPSFDEAIKMLDRIKAKTGTR